jgi:cytochrome c biogenesis protein
LMAVLAVLSLIGATVPQGEAAAYYTRSFGSFFGGLIWHLRLAEVFHSAYYTALLVLLCVMVLACSLKGLPARVRTTRPGQFLADPDAILRMTPSARQVVDLEPEEARLHAVDILKKHLYGVRSQAEGESLLVVASKMGLARYGSVILHLSFLFLLAGGISIAHLGSRAYETTRVGDAFDVVAAGGEILKVTVEDFDIEFDERSNVSDFLCDVAVRGRDGLIARATVSPNHPLKVMRREIYLVSYEEDPTMPEGFMSAVLDSTGRPVVPHLYIPVVEPTYVEELAANVQAVNGVVPQVRVTFDDGRVESQALGQGSQVPPGRAYAFVMMHAVPSVMVTLEVIEEPGQALVIIGLILLTAGGFVSLYLSHRMVWLVVRPHAGGKAEVVLGARSSRNREGMANEFEALRRTLDELA